MKTVAGIDLGTQSVKVIFYDFQNRQIVANDSAPLRLCQDDSGTAEQHAQWWVDALQEALAKIDKSIRESAIALGVSGQQHGFVPMNRSGEVLAPVKLWCDTSTEPECKEIMDRLGGRQVCLEEVGNLILPGYTASKISWLKNSHPALYEELDRILLPHDFLNFYLTGESCMEAGDASGSGFLDIRSRTWSTEMLRAIDPDRDLTELLPEVLLANQFIGQVQAAPARLLGLPEGLPVSIGGGDNMMGAIGTGNVSPGTITISLGTSGTVYAYSDRPVIDPAGNVAAFCSSTGGWLPLICTMNCTVTTELLRDLLAADITEFEKQVSRAARGSEGVITLPFFNGERTPNLPRAKACIVGLDSSNCRPENIMRSGMEGATYALRYGIDELRRLGVNSDEIKLTGGGARSASWRQMVADISAAPVTVYVQDEGASFGAALQALSALEQAGREDIQSIVRSHLTRDEAQCCEPGSGAVNFYKEAYESYREALTAVETLYA
jgi:xylulokinase